MFSVADQQIKFKGAKSNWSDLNENYCKPIGVNLIAAGLQKQISFDNSHHQHK